MKQSRKVMMDRDIEANGQLDLGVDFYTIDQHRLDEEWINQPKNFFKFAKMLADARSDYEQRKAEKELAIAELDQEIRSDPAKFGIDKITEACLAQAIALQPIYSRVQDKLLKAKHRMDVIQAAVDTMEHKKKALENITHLFSINYFATPRAPKASREDVKQWEENEVQRKIAKRNK